MKPKDVATQMKALDKYNVMILFTECVYIPRS